MSEIASGVVDIVREFLEAHQLMRRLFARYRSGDLRFPELEELISDDESSVLYRLKERCHALFRPTGARSRVVIHRETLFDLAVGSLFHEAMKFRENFYQREIYGPRVRALRSEADAEAKGLFREFERILAAGTDRLEEGLQESEALLDQTRAQLRVLLVEHCDNGFVARYLLEQRELVEAVFGMDLDALLAEIHGAAAEGYALAGRSYLDSGYYEQADLAFAGAIARGGEPSLYEPLCAYARGMRAYLAGDYRNSVEHLSRWLAAGAPGDAALRPLARAAVSRVGHLELGDDRKRVAAEAAALLERLASAGSSVGAGR